MKKILIDTDPGVDDFMAIVLAAQIPDWELVGISTVYGNASLEQVTKNALNILELLSLPHVPVAMGAAQPWQRAWDPVGASYVHGQDGLGNLHLPASKLKPLGDKADDFIYAQASQYLRAFNQCGHGL